MKKTQNCSLIAVLLLSAAVVRYLALKIIAPSTYIILLVVHKLILLPLLGSNVCPLYELGTESQRC